MITVLCQQFLTQFKMVLLQNQCCDAIMREVWVQGNFSGGGVKCIFFLDCDFLTTEDSWFVQGVSGRIQRADVARYMLRVAEENLHQKKIVAISPK